MSIIGWYKTILKSKTIRVKYPYRDKGDQIPLFIAPYDITDVSALFAIVAFVLIIAAIVGNNLFGLFQQNVNFGWFFLWPKFLD